MRTQISTTKTEAEARLMAATIMGNLLVAYLEETPRIVCPMKATLVRAMAKVQLDFDAWVNLLALYFPQFKDLRTLWEYMRHEDFTYTCFGTGEKQLMDFDNALTKKIIALDQQLEQEEVAI